MSENKTVFEQLADVQQELQDIKIKQRTFDDQLRENDPKIVDFVKTAKRIWRYSGEKSDLRRENNRFRKKTILRCIMLLVQVIIPLCFITVPYVWISFTFSGIVAILGAIYFIAQSKDSPYQIEYSELEKERWWNVYECDDNDIICQSREKGIFKALRILMYLVPILNAICLLVFGGFIGENTWAYIGGFFEMLLMGFGTVFFNSSGQGYQLYFIDKKNEILYYNLKEFMTRNNLK